MRKISNFKFQISNSQGFTLAEILVVLGVLAVMLIVLTEIFFSSIRGGNKTQIISSLNENGKVIMDMMDKNVQNADAVICPAFSTASSPDSNADFLVTLTNGIYTRYKFVPPQQVNGKDQNGRIERDFPAPDTEEEKDPNVFINSVCNPGDVRENEISITDTNVKSGVSVIDGSFTRNRTAGFKDAVTITFDLQPAVESTQKIPGRIDTVTFTTTIEVR